MARLASVNQGGDASIEVRWIRPNSESDETWQWRGVLYAYLQPDSDSLVYVGKAWGCTVASRFNAEDKLLLWADMRKEFGGDEVEVIVGEVVLPKGRRLSHELLADIESLLIFQLQPWGNIAAKRSRIRRPGLVVTCRGGWNGWGGPYMDQ